MIAQDTFKRGAWPRVLRERYHAAAVHGINAPPRENEDPKTNATYGVIHAVMWLASLASS